MQEVVRKLKFKGIGVVVAAPADIESQLVAMGFEADFPTGKKSGNTLVFVRNSEELLGFLKNKLTDIEFDSILWLAYPKGTSKVKTDINRDSIRAKSEEFGITTVAAISVDETWSALRFRPLDKVGK